MTDAQQDKQVHTKNQTPLALMTHFATQWKDIPINSIIVSPSIKIDECSGLALHTPLSTLRLMSLTPKADSDAVTSGKDGRNAAMSAVQATLRIRHLGRPKRDAIRHRKAQTGRSADVCVCVRCVRYPTDPGSGRVSGSVSGFWPWSWAGSPARQQYY